MRLRSLELENFRRHRRTRLEFKDGVTALVGPNGAGKSTLIEAIAFALYGPRVAATGKDLIRTDGAPPGDPVRAVLEFEVGGQAVRLVRELRGRAQSPIASLEVDGHVQVQPIAGSSEQATGMVERLLGLDRDGFFQTVVARQGELDRLARLKPAERRAFVLDLVGIGAVDAAIARARESRNDLRVQADEAARFVGDAAALGGRVQEAQAQATARQGEVHAAGQRLAKAEEEAAVVAAALDAARQADAERLALQGQASILAERATALHRDTERAHAELATAQAAVARVPELRAVAQVAEQIEVELATAQGMVLVRTRRSAQVARIAQQEDAIRRALADAEAIQVPAGVDVTALAGAAETVHEAAIAAGRDRAVAAERAAQARRDLAALGSLQGDAPCPSCRQPVTGDHLAAERNAADRRLAAAEGAALAASVTAQQAEQRLAAARAALARGQLEQRQAEAQARKRDAALQAAAGLQAGLAALRESLPADPGPAADVDALQQRAREAAAARHHLQQCEALAGRMPALRRAFHDAERAMQACDADLAGLRLRLATQPDTATTLAQARTAADAARRALSQALAAQTAALLAAQAAQAALDLAQADQARDAAARARLGALQADLARWTAVVGAAGGGLLERFREHLVARTAPAINQEASHLLALFTQGRYPDLVLDDGYELWMGDGGVLHPIERFSGGERDLAHLALRLGISRLLATRANAPEIRFLALDEVFSSLDQERCTTLLGALQNLGGLYSQVLAVTHIERLQESFDGVARVDLVDGEAQVTVHGG